MQYFKTILSAFTLVFSANFAYAQTIIPKIGTTFSKMTINEDDEIKYKIKPGFVIGAGISFLLIDDLLSLQPEILFIQKGTKFDLYYVSTDGSEYSDDKYKETVNYLEFPILAKATFGSGVRFHVVAGPSFSFGLGGKYKYESTYTFVGQSSTYNDSGKIKFGENEHNRVDIGLQFGGGVTLAEKFIIELRCALGLTDVYSSEDVVKNRVLQFTVGVPIALK